MHAEARTQLRIMRADADSEHRLREKAENELAAEKSSFEEEKASWKGVRTKLEDAVRHMETR